MSRDEPGIEGLSGDETELVFYLARLAPLMRSIEQAEAELDPGFSRTLRAHLLQLEKQAPRSGALPVRRRPLRQWPIAWAGAAAGALALLIGVLLALLLPRPQVPTIAAPYPTRADLLYSFPAPPAISHRLSPTVSLVHPRPGVPYAGHLRLTASPVLKAAPAKLPAYRLAPPRNVVALARRLYGIQSPVRRVVVGAATWAVAADGGSPSPRPLHSVAVSLDTGELIYHDRRNLALPRAAKALAPSLAVAVARQWLTLLGWPGNRMPLVGIESVPRLRKVREVEFGWVGVGRTATPGAVLWVTPDRSVIEAWVWPPVVRGGTIPARPVSAAWSEIRSGKLPLAVEGVPAHTHANGVASLRRFTIISILSSGRSRALYLVPIYRFAGTAHIPGLSSHAWFSLAPGGLK